MIDPEILLASLVAKLRDIPALVTLMGADAANIDSYVHSYPSTTNRYLAIQLQTAPSILIEWTGTQISNRSRGLAHSYSAYVKALGSAGPVFLALRNGIVTATNRGFYLTEVDPSCHPPDIQGCSARSIFLSEQLSLDYHEILIVLTERGVDN